jgi:hypothetical protein
MMTHNTLLTLRDWRPVCDIKINLSLDCRENLTPIPDATQAAVASFGKPGFGTVKN